MEAQNKEPQVEASIKKSEGPISRDTTIGDIIQKYPNVVDILMATGVHCVGCHVAAWERLEDGLKGHGKSDEEIDTVINELNTAIAAEKVVGNEEFTISEKAMVEVKKNLKEGQFLRVEVVSGGCSGMSYGLSLDNDRKTDDKSMEIEGVTVVADPESFKLIKGSRLDYLDTFEEKGFRFVNPNATGGCGCGKSFSA